MKHINKIIISVIMGAMVISFCGSFVFAATLKTTSASADAEYKDTRQEYLQEVDSLNASREALSGTDDRPATKLRALQEQIQTAILQKQRIFLKNTTNVLTKKLLSLEIWVSNRVVISENNRQSIIAEINQDMNWLAIKKSDVANASGASIKEDAKEINTFWREHQIKTKKVIGKIWVLRLNDTIEKFENVSVKVAPKIDILKSAGKDTARIESLLANFNQKIENAKEKRNQAEQKYQSINQLLGANILFLQTNQLIRSADKDLRDAHKIFVEIIKETRQLIR